MTEPTLGAAGDEESRPGANEDDGKPETVGIGSALAIGCVAVVLVLLLIAIVARVVFRLW